MKVEDDIDKYDTVSPDNGSIQDENVFIVEEMDLEDVYNVAIFEEFATHPTSFTDITRTIQNIKLTMQDWKHSDFNEFV